MKARQGREMGGNAVLFILAGTSGTGKSSILAQALQSGVPLFGRAEDALFRGLRLPAQWPEDNVRPHERLRQGTWFHETDIPFLSQLAVLPQPCVLHFELVSAFHMINNLKPLPPVLEAHRTLSAATFLDEAVMGAFFRALFSSGFFRRFEKIIVNTAYAPWTVTAAQWRAREDQLQREAQHSFVRFLRETIYGPSGETMHSRLYKSWFESLAPLKPALQLITDVAPGNFQVRRASEGMGLPV